jgi:RNAse (barnase) inhibitor barstar
VSWQVAVVLDEETPIDGLLGLMPVWAQTSPDRAAAAPGLRAAWDSCWDPEPALTVWTNPVSVNVLAKLVEELPIVELHHSNLACVRLFGVQDSQELHEAMANLGYFLVSGSTFPGLGFARTLDSLSTVRKLTLNGDTWQSADDFYSAFFLAVGAPKWHGRNFNALIDSIQTGRINKIEVPYKIVVQNPPHENQGVHVILRDFADLVGEMQSDGCPVFFQILDKHSAC